jgi:Tol biopolymer transport system component
MERQLPGGIATGAHARWLSAVVLAVAMFAFGFSVYHAAGSLKAERPAVQRPTQTSSPALPGVMYLTQGGAVYRFQNGSFKQLTTESGWTQPAVSPDGRTLAVVRRYAEWSDLYLMTTAGRMIAQLTHDYSPQVEANHWAFYPRFSADGSQLFYDYDPKDPYNSYRVDLAIFASPSDPASPGSLQWTYPNPYTGGDVNPLPLANGGLIYTKFSIDDQSRLHSQLWVQGREGSHGVALTDPELDCGQAAISADQRHVAMVCTRGQSRAADLDVAAFDEATLTLGTPEALVSGQLVASPGFSPDGSTVAYLAPAAAGGAFQLWTVRASGTTAPKAITSTLGLDSMSAPVWTAS